MINVRQIAFLLTLIGTVINIIGIIKQSKGIEILVCKTELASGPSVCV